MSSESDYLNLRKFVLMDRNRGGAIICSPSTAYHTKNLAMGFINCTPWTIAPSNALDDTINLNDPSIHYQYMKKIDKIQVIPEKYIAIELAEMRKQAIDRLNAFYILDFISTNKTSFLTDYYDSTIVGVMAVELSKCNPTENTYSEIIKEWAAIQEISVDIAYKELTLTYENTALTYIRNHAIYSKYVRLINQTTGWSNLKNVLADADYEFSRQGAL